MSENTKHQQIFEKISALIQPMGFEVVHLDLNLQQKALRLFIDHLTRTDGIGIEDCVSVTRALDEPLDQMTELNDVFGAAGYELEVSSPGVDRPLRTVRDFEKFSGREVRVHLFRPASGAELKNDEYAEKNPKQKNFLGTLKGISENQVMLSVNLTGGRDEPQKKKGQKPSKSQKQEVVVNIPLPLISKANLEPDFTPLQGEPSAEVAETSQESEPRP